MSRRNVWAWILGTIGLLGVVVPHVSFLAGMISSLSSVSHATIELISATLLLFAFLLKK